MKSINKSKIIVCGLLLVVLALSGCSFIRIQNISDARLRVLVRVPDNRKGYTRSIQPGQIVDVFSGQGGRYSVTTLPDEQYRQLLIELRAEVSRRLFVDRQNLSADDVALLTSRLNDADSELERLNSGDSAFCAGFVPEFETVVVTAAWDLYEQNWSLVCQ